ncbi:PAS domain S-box-containing protein [Verrucomicrobium sp. GAS474]|nr:PAS domain S-box-containing protein [Verrucomicrobium sp. GAS474]
MEPHGTRIRTTPNDLQRENATGNEALRVSELSYRRLFEAAKDGILILDVETGRINDVNPFLFKLLGFSHSEMVGKTVGELSPFKDIESNQAMLERLQQHGYVRYEDLPLETKDGRHIAVEFVSNVYQAGSEKVIQCSIRDITDRKKSEQWQALLNTCVSNLNDIFIVIEADPLDEPGPRIVFVNEAFERITGYTSAETLGRSPRFLNGERTDPLILKEIHQAMRDRQPIRRQIINYGKDGTEYWLDIDLVPIFDGTGRCTHFSAIERDITEGKRNEAQLLWKTAFFEAQVNSSLDGIVIVDSEGTIILQNQQMIDLWNIPQEFADEVDNRRRLDWVTSQVKNPRQFAESVAYLSAHPDEISRDELELNNGKVFDRYSAPVRGKEGDRYGRIWAYRDITERKKLEHQFLRAQRMESIGTLAGGIAHDLNNILAPIMLSIDTLKFTSDEKDRKDILETIEVSAKRGADIVRQVLSFARGLEGQRIEVQPKHLLKDLESIIKDTFPKDIRLLFSVPNDTWTILGDPTQIHQILLNLCVNARDAMPNGGSLTIGVENCLLDEQYAGTNTQTKAGRYVHINVTDSGMGMPPDVLDKIFEPFFTTKELNKGTGLGLSTVMGVVKSHGGMITVYSEPGNGTTFKVYLPAMEASSVVTPEQPEEVTLPKGNGEMILVVDDEAAILSITSRTLLSFGYRVLTATNGADAVAVYAEHKNEIAVVLTDMMMPIMNGPATIQALTRINPAVRIIATSGLNANNGGTKHFLMKPYTAETLLKTLRTILDKV